MRAIGQTDTYSVPSLAIYYQRDTLVDVVGVSQRDTRWACARTNGHCVLCIPSLHVRVIVLLVYIIRNIPVYTDCARESCMYVSQRYIHVCALGHTDPIYDHRHIIPCMYVFMRALGHTDVVDVPLCDVEDIHRHSHSHADSDDRR